MTSSTAVAIIGMAGRFPGADTVQGMWQNLVDGVESIRRLSDAELKAAGVPAELASRSAYVPASAEVADVDAFDADFFSMPAHEARLMDPQHRIFLECAWSSLEDAGYTPAEPDLRIGVFGSTSVSSYLINVLAQSEEMTPGEVNYPLLLGNDKDFLATRVSYKLGLTGPSMTVQTACSGSLTAVHLACQSLIESECSMAIAGGVSISVPSGFGYLYREGGILSADGHCRVFDSAASGTVKGNGCGVVVLRLLDDALAAGDHIYAVIRGTAINNDGSDKVGFTAPSAVGQQEVIREALQVAGVPAADIGYVEAHGTGTAMGDPIELRALAAAHRADGGPPDRCVVGSIKANIGHLDAASGVVGLIKTAMVLQEQMIPGQPTLQELNPLLELAGSPYVVLTHTEKAGDLRAAAVSSFGLGGTNAHAVLVPAEPTRRGVQPSGRFAVPLYGSDDATLRQSAQRLRNWLVTHPLLRVDDVAHTLTHGRQRLAAAAWFTGASIDDLVLSLDRFLAGGPASAAATSGGSGDLSAARRISLPGTPFRRARHWAVAPKSVSSEPINPRTTDSVGPPGGSAVSAAAIAARIQQIVGDQLGIDVEPDDDFFDLGVESMTLVEIVTKLRDVLGVPIAFEEAESTRTAADLAALLAPKLADDQDVAVQVNPPITAPETMAGQRPATFRHAAVPLRAGSGRNVFLVHPAGGTTICYADLARHLDSTDSLYGIGFPMELAAHGQSIRQLAKLYIELVREVQPSGPYIIGGYSFGGNVAFEMALMLENIGEEVQRLVMFDSHPPEAYVGGHIGEADYLGAFPVLLRSLFPDVTIAQGREINSVADALEMVRQPGWSPAMMHELELFFEVWRNNHRALRCYYPDQRVQADVLMMEATEPESADDLQRLGMRVVRKDRWKEHLQGDFTVVPVGGNHFSMFRERAHIAGLAERLHSVW